MGLELFHLQLDELYGYVKQAGHEIWVWTVVDAKTKLMPVLQIGPRTQAMAYGVVHELNSRLKAGCVPVFSSDGLMHYFYALTAHFGEWIDVEGQGKPVWMVLESFFYAQVVKCQRRFRLVSVEHKVIWGMPSEYAQRLKTWGLSGRINTSFVERANLTIRRCVSKLMRRTWGTAQYPTELGEHLSWWSSVLSLCEIPRKSANQTGSADGSQRKTTTETISKKNANDGSGDHDEAMECAGIDQLSTAII